MIKHILKTYFFTWLLLCLAGGLIAQNTRVDAGRQVRNFDLRQAALTAPVRTGATLPGTCVEGEAFFLTGGSSGERLYFCATGGSWAQQGRSLVLSSQGRDFQVEQVAPEQLRINSACQTSTPCKARVGATSFDFTQPATVTLTAGSGLAVFYLDSTGQIVVTHNLSLTCDANCVAISESAPQAPLGALPLFSWTATDGIWDGNAGTDLRAFLSIGPEVLTGAGLLLTRTSTFNHLSLDTTVVPVHLTASATIDFGTLASQTCSENTLPLTGATTGDAVAGGWPPTLDPQVSGMMLVSAADLVTVRLCNQSSSAVSLSPLSFRATVVRSF